MPIKPSSVGRTGLLVTIALAAVLVQLFPAHAGAIKWAVILSGLVYLIAQALTTYPKFYLGRKRLEAQRAADEFEYRNYERDLAGLRSKYPAERVADAALPPEYHAALTALNEQHREMLTRKFGAY